MGGTVHGLTAWEDIAPEPLVFPIGGRTYTVQPLSYKDGLRLEHLLNDPKAREGMTGADLWRLGLGAAFDEMVEGDVPPAAIERAGLAAITDHQRGREAAALIWESGIRPEALAAASTAAKKTTKKTTGRKKASTPSTGTAAARKTPSRASTSGTRTSRTR